MLNVVSHYVCLSIPLVHLLRSKHSSDHPGLCAKYGINIRRYTKQETKFVLAS
jgi:hypothetical protein